MYPRHVCAGMCMDTCLGIVETRVWMYVCADVCMDMWHGHVGTRWLAYRAQLPCCLRSPLWHLVARFYFFSNRMAAGTAGALRKVTSRPCTGTPRRPTRGMARIPAWHTLEPGNYTGQRYLGLLAAMVSYHLKLKWWESRHCSPQANLGLMHEMGWGVPKDVKEVCLSVSTTYVVCWSRLVPKTIRAGAACWPPSRVDAPCLFACWCPCKPVLLQFHVSNARQHDGTKSLPRTGAPRRRMHCSGCSARGGDDCRSLDKQQMRKNEPTWTTPKRIFCDI